MFIRIIIAFMMFSGLSTLLNAETVHYNTSCRIVDGKAKGFIRLVAPSSSTSFSGTAKFRQYDVDGDLVDTDSVTVVVVVVGSSLKLVGDVRADDDAVSCELDLSGILGPAEGNRPNLHYQTFCEIRDGVAYGSMRLTGETSSLSFGGSVTFTFFDQRGSKISESRTTAVVVIVGHDRKEVDDIRAPQNATTCFLDVSAAIED